MTKIPPLALELCGPPSNHSIFYNPDRRESPFGVLNCSPHYAPSTDIPHFETNTLLARTQSYDVYSTRESQRTGDDDAVFVYDRCSVLQRGVLHRSWNGWKPFC